MVSEAALGKCWMGHGHEKPYKFGNSKRLRHRALEKLPQAVALNLYILKRLRASAGLGRFMESCTLRGPKASCADANQADGGPHEACGQRLLTQGRGTGAYPIHGSDTHNLEPQISLRAKTPQA